MFECERVVQISHLFHNGSSTFLNGTGSHQKHGTLTKMREALRPRFVICLGVLPACANRPEVCRLMNEGQSVESKLMAKKPS